MRTWKIYCPADGWVALILRMRMENAGLKIHFLIATISSCSGMKMTISSVKMKKEQRLNKNLKISRS